MREIKYALDERQRTSWFFGNEALVETLPLGRSPLICGNRVVGHGRLLSHGDGSQKGEQKVFNARQRRTYAPWIADRNAFRLNAFQSVYDEYA